MRTPGGRTRSGQVVVFDPRRDIAVLRVPGLKAPTLRFHRAALEADSALVIGYSKGAAEPSAHWARILTTQRAEGSDIYRTGRSGRQVHVVRVPFQPGDSGSPVLAPDGTVYGLAFAGSLSDKGTAYALTSDEIAPVAQDGRTAARPVSTQSCTD